MSSERKRSRGAGEGTILLRKDGRWCAALREEKERRKYLYGRTREEVAEKLNKAIGRRIDGLPLPNDRITVRAFLEEWLEHTVRQGVRPWTYRGYEVHVRRHIVPELGKLRLGKLTTAHVRRWVSKKLDAGLAPKTVNYMKGTLSTALNQAVEDGLVARNAAAPVRTSKKPRNRARPLDLAETRRFLRAIRGDHWEALYLVGLLGLRQGEVLGLCWHDVDLEKGVLHVERALQRPRGRYELVDPKTESSRRLVKLPGTVVAKLRDHRTRQIEDQLRVKQWHNAWDLVFTTSTGAPLNSRVVLSGFQKKKLAEAGLPKIRFHDLRHGCSSLLQAGGLSPRVAQEQLGHSDLSMTLRYTKVLPELAEAAARRMEEVLGDLEELDDQRLEGQSS